MLISIVLTVVVVIIAIFVACKYQRRAFQNKSDKGPYFDENPPY